MLTFEDDIKPTAMPLGMMRTAIFDEPAGYDDVQIASKPAKPAMHEAKQPVSTGRIRVEDKRIINCKADVNQLVPFKYKWAWDKYIAACANHWMPQEVNMTADIALWKSSNLTDDERLLVKRNLGFSVPLTVWRQTTSRSAPIVISPIRSAASTCCAKPLKRRFIPMLTSTSWRVWGSMKAKSSTCTTRCPAFAPRTNSCCRSSTS